MKADAVFLVALLLLSPSLAGGQVFEGPTRATNRLMVTVRSDGPAGELPGYVRVELYRRGELWRDEAADASGQYSFSGLPDGRYTVLARGLHSQSVGQTVDLSQNQTRQVVLRLIPNRVPWPPAGSSRNSQALVSVEEWRCREERARNLPEPTGGTASEI